MERSTTRLLVGLVVFVGMGYLFFVRRNTTQSPWEFSEDHNQKLQGLLWGDKGEVHSYWFCNTTFIEQKDLRMVGCKGEMQNTPSWMWGKPDEEEGAEREMCVLDDVLDVLSEDSPGFARLSEHHQRWLPHPLDFNGAEVTEVREREPIPFVLVLRDANVLGTGYVYDHRFLYRSGYWYVAQGQFSVLQD